MATPLEYQLGMQALQKAINAVLEQKGLSWIEQEQSDLVAQFSQQGSRAVIDAVDAQRKKIEAMKGMD